MSELELMHGGDRIAEVLREEQRRLRELSLDGKEWSAPVGVHPLSLQEYSDEVCVDTSLSPEDIYQYCFETLEGLSHYPKTHRIVPLLLPHNHHGMSLEIVYVDAEGRWGDRGYLDAYLPQEICANTVEVEGRTKEDLFGQLLEATYQMYAMVGKDFGGEIFKIENVEGLLEEFRKRLG